MAGPLTDAVAELRRWAASGAMALTGRRQGPPTASPGRPASTVTDALRRIRAVHPAVPLPGVGLLGERAAAAGLRRDAPRSCGGVFRVLRTRDGHLGLSLPRDDDLAAVPALVSAQVDDAWEAVAAWSAGTGTAEAVDRARLLGLACAPVVSTSPAQPLRPPAVVAPLGTRKLTDRPLVVDFTSLWAGPLCAHLLSLCGAEVVKVESVHRLDGGRHGSAAFYDLLHAGHRSVTVDFDSPADMDRLRRLVHRADLVLEASRARALHRRGLVAADVVAAGTSWLSVTAYGRDQDLIGFGDDVAAGAGLLTADLFPCGDALADPLTGVTAAACAVEALAGPQAVLIDVSMHTVAARAVVGGIAPHEVVRRDGAWWVDCDAGRFPVADPRLRPASGVAAMPGAHNGGFRRDPAAARRRR
ncbi:CoA transferase [Streptomyces mirabilis]|uniref:CoA transferase n=1 Tax=Streptomyces mirabilis TaxID=68239 RepID=UPI0033A9E92A